MLFVDYEYEAHGTADSSTVPGSTVVVVGTDR
jgi:hypothetical protein